MVADPLASSEAFIKAIKGVSDPPVEGGLSKVELALEALSRSSLYIPARAEIITEWAISKMCKERMSPMESTPCLDEKFWCLVSRALSTNGQASLSKANHMWLNPLLLRYPLLPLMSTVMNHAQSVSDEFFLECCTAVRAITAYSATKPTYDASWELFLGTISAIVEGPQKHVQDTENLWFERPPAQSFILLAIEHCRPTLCEGNNRKKALAAFMNGSIVTWVVAQAKVQRLVASTDIGARLSEMATSVLFAPESLRQHLPAWAMADETRTSILDLLFSESADVSATLSILPSFFQSLVSAIHQHRSTIFAAQAAAGSAERLPPKARAKRSSMAFLRACTSHIDVLSSELLNVAWGCKSELLAIVEAESLIQSDDTDGHSILRSQAPKAVEVLAKVRTDSNAPQMESSIRVLTSLIRLDYTLVEPLFPALFPVLARISASPLSHELLSVHLTYHIKTRTLQDVVSLLCTAITKASPPPVSGFRRAFVGSCLGGRSYANELSAAISRYLTQSQVAPTVETVVKNVQELRSYFNECARVRSNDSHTPQKKKRRISGSANVGVTTSDATSRAMQAASRFASALYVAGVVLVSVPIHTASQDALSTIKTYMLTLRDEVILPAISLTLFLSEGVQVDEPSQLVTAAALRLAYSLQGYTFWRFDSPNPNAAEMEDLGRRADLLLKANDTLPELRVELVRTVLQHHSSDPSYPLLTPSPTFFTVLVSLLTSRDGDDDAKWDGSFASLDYSAGGRSAAVLAIWELLLDRWLVVIDAYASPEMLDVVVRTLIQYEYGTRVGIDHGGNITLGSICRRALNSAQFWEMRNIRTVLLSTLEAKCQGLQAIDIDSALRSNGKVALSNMSLDEANRALHFVLHMPIEYLDKARRALIARSAVVCDVLLSKAGRSQVQDYISLRTLIFRIAQQTGNVDLLASNLSVVYFLSSSTAYASDTPEESSVNLHEITLKLLQLVHTLASNTAAKGASSLLISLLAHYKNTIENESIFELKTRSAVQLLHTLATHADFTKILTAAVHECDILFRMVYLPAAQALKEISFCDGEMNSRNVETLNLWGKLLKVKAWLGIKDNSQPLSVLSLLKLLTSQTADIRAFHSFPDMHLAVLRVIIQDSLSKTDRTLEDVSTVLAATAVIGKSLGTDVWARLEPTVARFPRALTATEFEHALGSLYGAVSGGHVKNERLFLLLLSSIFVRNSPDGSFKTNQEYTSRCLHTIARLDLVTDTDLVTSGLKIILELVGDKSSSLRNADVASIYIIFGQAVAGSAVHDSSTRHSVYETIVSILLAIVRLRRDLVASSLSHFALVVSRLCEILRAVRPELAARQRRSVTDTLPRWINPSQPLPPECAKALARLITNLNTKTIVRSGPSAQSDVSAAQAQSLAQPFTKHAPYVITAYIRALINPLSVMAPRVRQELEPGLFALCDMMGEHGRDAIMKAMFDDSGKAMMRLLWTEYDKQRYIGKG